MGRKIKKQQSGQALIVIIIFFVLASVTVLGSLAGPVLRTSRNTSQLLAATRNYYAAEAATEDVVYRLRAGKEVSVSETLNLDGAQAVTTITDVPGGKTIETVGILANTTRKITSEVIAGDGISFNYGVQTGNGGLQMSNNAQIIGNIYANGSIIGSNGAVITGSAVSANSAALAADQTNNTPLPPTYNLNFGNASGSQDAAQSFQTTESGPVNKVRLYLKKVSTPANLTVRIVNDADGLPGTNTLVSATLSAALVGANYAWIELPFPSNPTLTVGTAYWLVLDGAANAAKYYVWGANTGYSNGAGKIGQYNGAWSDTNPAGLDAYFELYLGGVNGSISAVSVGQNGVGDARAHSVSNTNIAGNLYCQTGSGNNKPCDTSQPDPAPQPFPVSDANISDWKADAALGGVIDGDYAPGGESATLGPKKITGNLILTNGFTLTLSGTLWVVGDIELSNNAVVKLSSGYGTNGGVVVSDGEIDLSNGAQFSGSGQAGSYVLLLTTSSSGSAAEVGNNAGAVIINAQKGTINFSNNAGAKEATADKIFMDNGATIIYESGLANINFTSGPSGSWNIVSWQEVE